MTTPNPDNDEFKSERFAAEAGIRQMYAEKWIDISLDTDRQLLTLSTAAIGVIAAFITTKGIGSTSQLLIVCFSVVCFVLVIAGILLLFNLNRNFLAFQGAGKVPDESLMLFLDKAIRILFFAGIFGTSVYALRVAIQDVEKSSPPTQGASNESKDRTWQEPSGPHPSERKLGREPNTDPQRKPGGDVDPSSDRRSNQQQSFDESHIQPSDAGESPPKLG